MQIDAPCAGNPKDRKDSSEDEEDCNQARGYHAEVWGRLGHGQY